jgi:tRNA dimethylallyltransferase
LSAARCSRQGPARGPVGPSARRLRSARASTRRRGVSWLHCTRDWPASIPSPPRDPANDAQRIQRALEVFELSGKPMSALLARSDTPGRASSAPRWPRRPRRCTSDRAALTAAGAGISRRSRGTSDAVI